MCSSRGGERRNAESNASGERDFARCEEEDGGEDGGHAKRAEREELQACEGTR